MTTEQDFIKMHKDKINGFLYEYFGDIALSETPEEDYVYHVKRNFKEFQSYCLRKVCEEEGL